MALSTADDQPRIWIQKNYASFNGIRGLAVLLVFCSHFIWFAPLFQLAAVEHFGVVGVDLFFVLSGFLITGILYDVLGQEHYFRNFYIRRTLRIFPLFYVMYLLILVCTPLFHLHLGGYMGWYAVYLGNLLPFFTGPGFQNTARVQVHGVWYTALSLGNVWSLCVEEQFYVVWPAVVFAIRERNRLMRLCVVGCILAVVIRAVLWRLFAARAEETNFIYMGTFSRFDSLLVGAFLALYLRGNKLTLRQLRSASAWLFIVPGAVALIGGLFKYHRYYFQGSPFTETIGFTLIALSAAGVLLRSLDDTSRISSCLRWPPLARLGIVSYGFYLIHAAPGVLLHEIDSQRHDWFHAHHILRLAIVIGWFAMSWMMAELSFRFYESRLLNLKNKLAPENKKPHLEFEMAQ